MSRTRSTLLDRPLDVLLRPERLVEPHEDMYDGSLSVKAQSTVRLLVFYMLNVVLYATPLTIAGFGVAADATAPETIAPWLGLVMDPDGAWAFLLSLGQNSLFLFVATVLTLVTFHVGVLLTRSSQGLLLTIRTVTYSTGLYLATIFTLVWYLSIGDAIAVADDLLIALQASFVYFFIDLLGTDLALPGGRPEMLPTTGLTAVGTAVLVALIVAGLYYLYLLYLGARITHRGSRFAGLVAVGFVTVSPVLYVVGSILAYEFFGGVFL
ncbi:hypothetical protein [Halorientalis halophila]|uniref:hypothetical protein n=1 Tax=Halorientalis halophila TaxID=3108499 RepID=UPI0030091901